MPAKTLAETRMDTTKKKEEPISVSSSVGQVISITDRPDGKKEILIIVEGDYKLNEVYKVVK